MQSGTRAYNCLCLLGSRILTKKTQSQAKSSVAYLSDMQMKVFRGFAPSQLLPSMITSAWQEIVKGWLPHAGWPSPVLPSIHAPSQGQALRCRWDLFWVHCWGKAWEIEQFRLCPLPAICSTERCQTVPSNEGCHEGYTHLLLWTSSY